MRLQIIGNIPNTKNPTYILEDFYNIYPFFEKVEVPEAVLNMYLELADACIKKSRWKSSWEMAMSLFIAHFLILYLQNSHVLDFEGEVNINTIVSSGMLKGLKSSKSVDGVSVSYDFSHVLNGLDGFAGWTATSYGTQLANLAKIYGKGVVYVN